MHNPSHPGELLRTWIEGANLTVTQLAGHIGVSRATLSRIINGHAGVHRRDGFAPASGARYARRLVA